MSIHPFDFFDGGVSPIDMFEMECSQLKHLQVVVSQVDDDDYSLITSTPSIIFVSLLSFAEGFFRSTFSAVGNMCPTALVRFSTKRADLVVPFHDVLTMKERLEQRAGSIIAEHIDFGSAKKLNSVFSDLIGASPFTKNNILRYEKLRNKRNQIVHHGGLVTGKFLRQNKDEKHTAEDLYWGSVEITERTIIETIEFLVSIANKLTDSCYKKMIDLEGNKTLCAKSTEYDLFEYFKGDYKTFNK